MTIRTRHRLAEVAGAIAFLFAAIEREIAASEERRRDDIL